LDLSLLGVQENGSNPFAVMCLASLQTKRLVREAQGASLHLSAYVDDIAACLGGSTNCDEIVFRQAGSSTLNLSLGVASAKDRRLYASVADRAV